MGWVRFDGGLWMFDGEEPPGLVQLTRSITRPEVAAPNPETDLLVRLLPPPDER